MTVLPPQFWIHILRYECRLPDFQDISSDIHLTMSDLVSPLYLCLCPPPTPCPHSFLTQFGLGDQTRITPLADSFPLPHTPAFLHCICQAEPQPWLNPPPPTPCSKAAIHNWRTTIQPFQLQSGSSLWILGGLSALSSILLRFFGVHFFTLLQLSFCKTSKPTPKLHAWLSIESTR